MYMERKREREAKTCLSGCLREQAPSHVVQWSLTVSYDFVRNKCFFLIVALLTMDAMM